MAPVVSSLALYIFHVVDDAIDVAREIIDALVTQKKHEVLILSRKVRFVYQLLH